MHGGDRVFRPREHRTERIADRFEDGAAVLDDRGSQQFVVPAYRDVHRRSIAFPTDGAAFDVRERERERPARRAGVGGRNDVRRHDASFGNGARFTCRRVRLACDVTHGSAVETLVKNTDWFARVDESSDAAFYAQPRFVEHIGASAIAAVTELYRERLPAGGRILDAMSSWISHLPSEIAYASVTGLGMNERELAANPRLTDAVVHDLNRRPALPFANGAFDAATICVSIQYLTQPAAVLREIARVCIAGAPIVITFSNRCFPTKAVAIWNALDDADHVRLVERYLADAGWGDIASSLRTLPRVGDPLYAVTARRP